jgi:hypothetical protein
MKIEFNDREVEIMIGLIDLAVKAGGLSVADQGLAIARKLRFAVNQQSAAADESEENE